MVANITGWGNDNTFDYIIQPGTVTGADNSPVPNNNHTPIAAGSAEGGPLIAWLSNTGVEVQFLDVLGEPTVAAAEVASHVVVSEGADCKSNVQVADGVAAFGVGWEDASGSTGQIHLQGLGPEGGLPFGTLVTVGSEASDGFDNTLFSNHSMSIAGYDFSTSVPTVLANGNAGTATTAAPAPIR